MMEYNMEKLSDLIISIPIEMDSSLTTPNLFLHYLTHEDWFTINSLSPEDNNFHLDQNATIMVLTKDLETPKM